MLFNRVLRKVITDWKINGRGNKKNNITVGRVAFALNLTTIVELTEWAQKQITKKLPKMPT